MPPGSSTQSIAVPFGTTVLLSIKGNVPNGIIEYVSILGLSNNNFPVAGLSVAIYFTGNGLVWNSLPSQIVGTNNAIASFNSGAAISALSWNINNNTGSTQTVRWSYITLLS